MKANIDIAHSILDEMSLTVDQLQEAVLNALSNLNCPKTGNPLYFNGVQVTVVAHCPEVVSA